MDFHTTSSSASPATGDLAVDRFNRATAFLRSVGTTAVRVAGSLAGAHRVGGVDETGDELQGASLFRSFGSVVNINPGGFFGVEGQGLFGGEGQGIGAGSSSADGATILSSKGSMTLRSSTGSSAHVEDGESPLLPSSPQVIREGWHRTQRSATRMAGLGAHQCLSRGGHSQQLPSFIRRKTEKMFFLLLFNLQEVMAGGADAICCGIVGEGSRFCSKLTRHCVVRDHSRKRMFDVMDMEDGFYINDTGVG